MRRPSWFRALLCLVCLVAACKNGGDAQPPPPPSPPPPGDASTPPPPSGFGTIRGKVVYDGPVPGLLPIETGSDPACGKAAIYDDSLITGAGGALSNAVVALRDSPESERGPSDARVELSQKGCRYLPRIMAVEGGTTITISNGDMTLHNVHTYKRNGSTWFNQAQPPGSPPMMKQANQSGQLLTFKCDVHPWMTAHVVVTDHPYFAVTGADGSFVLANVPAGKHTVESWHEDLGTLSLEVTVAADATAEISFNYPFP